MSPATKSFIKYVTDYSWLSKVSSSLLLGNVNPAVSPLRPSDVPIVNPLRPRRFDINNVVIEPGNIFGQEELKSFLHLEYFKNHPTITRIAKGKDNPLLTSLVQRYTTSGDQWLAYRVEPTTKQRYIIGAIVAYKKLPWEINLLEQWANETPEPESYYWYFCAHCMRSANIFDKYKIPCIYDIELLATPISLWGNGLEQMLLTTALQNVIENIPYPLVQVLSTSKAVSEACERSGMTLEWSTDLSQYKGEDGRFLFCSGNPDLDTHTTADLFIRILTPKYQYNFFERKLGSEK